MKKRLLAWAALAGCAGLAQAQSGVVVYGIVDAVAEYNTKVATGSGHDAGGLAALGTGGLQASRIGIRGKEDLGGGLFAEFGLENGYAADTGATLQGGALFGRRSVVGLSGPAFGVLHIGRRKDFTDEVARDYSSITPYSGFITGVHANNLDRIGGNRADNMIYYSTPTVAGWRANVSIGLGEAPGARAIGRSFGFGVNYSRRPFAIGFGYWQSTLGSATVPSSDQGATAAGCSTTLSANAGKAGATCIVTWIAGARYAIGPVTLRGTFSAVRQPLVATGAGAAPDFAGAGSATAGASAFTAGGVNNRAARIIDVGADLRLAPALLMTTSAIASQYDFVGAASRGRLYACLAGAQYYLSRRTTLYATAGLQGAAAMYNPGTGAGAPGADRHAGVAAAGIRLTF